MSPADVPDPSTWHHAWCRLVGETRVGNEEEAPVSSEEEKNKALLRLAAQGSSSPGQMLRGVNEVLFPNIPSNMFVTCFYAILDPKSGRLSHANAGHDLPYLHRNGDTEELRAR